MAGPDHVMMPGAGVTENTACSPRHKVSEAAEVSTQRLVMAQARSGSPQMPSPAVTYAQLVIGKPST